MKIAVSKTCTRYFATRLTLLLLPIVPASFSQTTLTQSDMLRALVARDALYAPPTSSQSWGMVSSSTPPSKIKSDDASADALHFRGTDGDWDILADVRGPGVISRIWTRNPTGTLRIKCDESIVFESDFADLFQQKAPPFEIPFSFRESDDGAGVCVFPIGFQNRCVISGRGIDQPYEVNYSQFSAEDVDIESFAGEIDPATSETYEAVKKTLLQGFTPKEVDDGQKMLPIAIHEKLAHGAMLTDQVKGMGVIRAFYFAITQRADPIGNYALHRCVLRIYFDAESSPSVEVPLIDFFASPLMQKSINTLYAGTDMMLDIPLPDRRVGKDHYAYCYFPMPFRDGMRFELLNFSGEELDVMVYLRVARQNVAPNALRFFAQHVSANPLVRNNFTWFDGKGPGRVLGVSLGVDSLSRDWLQATTPQLIVDGKKPLMGANVAGLLGISGRTSRIQTALNGVALADASTKFGGVRWFEAGGVPFLRSLFASLRWDESMARPDDFFSAVVYGYAVPTASKNFARIRSEALGVPGVRFENAIEIEGRVRDNAGSVVNEDDARGVEYSGQRAVKLPEGKPVRIAIPLLEPQRAELLLRVNPRRRFETVTIRSVEGEEKAEIAFSERANGLYSLGEWNLTSGSNLVEVVATGPVVADCWVLRAKGS
ncbi:MAG: DUF2961 domain-containing protein [Phycisphaerae bacterium]